MAVALLSLIGCGVLLGLSTNIAKYAYLQGVSALPFLAGSLAGATAVLSLMLAKQVRKIHLSKPLIGYLLISAFFSVAGSNFILFSAIPYVGVSYIALTMTLPPLLTYVIALVLKVESYNVWRAGGVVFAFAGAALLVISKWSLLGVNQQWALIALLGPLLLAMGNIYRSAQWPQGFKPEQLALGMLFVAAMMLILVGFIHPKLSLSMPLNRTSIGLIVFQSFVFAGQFLLLFILQRTGGPVLLSLIGSVSALFGVPVAVFLLGEALSPVFIPAAALIVFGVMCMLFGQSIVQVEVDA